MDVLATREFQYTDDHGEERNVLLTIFTPYAQVDERGWRGAFAFGPPIARLNGKTIPSGGVDFLQCFLCAVEVARGYLMGSDLAEYVHWQGMRHFGLPWHHPKPEGYQPPPIPPSEANPGNLEVLTQVRLPIPYGENDVHELILSVYRPSAADQTKWTCAFAFGPGTNEPVHYGIGADFIEALLDALAIARVTYESMVPEAWRPRGLDEFDGVEFWPYKMGREYFTEPPSYSHPDMPRA
jgi:hypothetical protein